MPATPFRRFLVRWAPALVIILLVLGAISDLGGAWQSWQGAVKWLVERLSPAVKKFFESNETIFTVATFAVAILVIAILAALLQHILNAQPGRGAGRGRAAAGRRGEKTQTTRQRYLEYLREDVLNRRKASIHFARFIDIGLSESLHATMPLNFVAHDIYIFPTAEVKQYTTFEEAFEDYKRRILLLGHPGSGKTTTLHDLALTLIDEAERDPSAPVPLLLNLSKYSAAQEKGLLSRLSPSSRKVEEEGERARAFERWLVRMLNEVPVEGIKNVSRQWVEGAQVALLLDGLDEVNDVHVKELVRLMNETYLSEHPQQTVVVCSRIIEYQPLKESKETRLALRGAATLKPLDRGQINAYLEAAEATALRDALFDHEDLYEMAESPLTLSMMTLAYGGKAPLDVPRNQPFLERRRWLLDTYVSRMVQRNARRLANVPFDLNPDNDVPTRYPLEKINHYLGWLAIKLSERMRTLLPLGRLHSILSVPPADMQSRVFTSTNVATMIVGTLVSLLTLGAVLYSSTDGAGPTHLLTLSLLAPVSFIIVFALSNSHLLSMGSKRRELLLMFICFGGVLVFFVLCFGLLNATFLSLLPDGVHPVAGTAMLSLLIFVLLNLTETSDRGKLTKELKRLAFMLLPCLLLGVLAALAVTPRADALPLGLATGSLLFFFVNARGENDEAGFAVFSFHFLWMAAATLGLGWGVTWFVGGHGALALSLAIPATVGALLANKGSSGAAVVFAAALVVGHLLGGVALGIPLALAAAAICSRFLKEESHLAAERLLLNPALEVVLLLSGGICFRYRSFLRYAADTLLLKHSGAEYEFVHRLLRDHFAIRELIPALFNASGDDQLRIINQLSRQGDSGFDALSGLISYPDSRVRVAAVEGLGRIAIPKVVSVFKRILTEDAEAEVRAAVLRSLEKLPMDDTLFDLLKLGLADGAPRVRSATLSALNTNARRLRDRDKECVEMIRAGLGDPSEEVFQEALVVVSERDYSHTRLNTFLERQFGRVRAALGARSPSVRSAALHLIGLRRDKASLPDFVAALKDPDSEVRVMATSVLSMLGSPDAIPALLAVADDANASVRSASLASIGAIAAQSHSPTQKESAKQALLKSLSDKEIAVRYAAADALGHFNGPDVTMWLERALRDRAGIVRTGALNSLSKLKDPRAAASLLGVLKNKSHRMKAAQALADIREPSVNQTLRSWLARGNADLRVAAIITLSLSGDSDIAPQLRELLAQPPKRYAKSIRNFFSPESVNLKTYAAVALGRLGDPDSLDSLLSLPEHEPLKSRLARVIALTYFPHDLVMARLDEKTRQASGKSKAQLSSIAKEYSNLESSYLRHRADRLFPEDTDFFEPVFARRS
jgi:HEAT repeat protein/type II secretory pathway predicted ATPase ExeA